MKVNADVPELTLRQTVGPREVQTTSLYLQFLGQGRKGLVLLPLFCVVLVISLARNLLLQTSSVM